MDELGIVINPVTRRLFSGVTLRYIETDVRQLIGNPFEIAYYLKVDESEILSALTGDGIIGEGIVEPV